MSFTAASTARATRSFLSARPLSGHAPPPSSRPPSIASSAAPGRGSRRSPASIPTRLPHCCIRASAPADAAQPIATGLGVSPGAASGVIVFTAEDAARCKARGRHCILVVTETGPADIEGMKAATGILTARGGMTSHAAVVARITGKPCVAGVRNLSRRSRRNDLPHRRRDVPRAATASPSMAPTARVYLGALPLSQPHIGGAMGKLLDWSDATRQIEVRANAETVEAATTALSFGAEGIGLARSEHMFFSRERMVALRRLILSEDEDDRAAALTGLVDFQTGDYSGDLLPPWPAGRSRCACSIRRCMNSCRAPTRTSTRPRASLGLATARAAAAARAHRRDQSRCSAIAACRLAITYPEILEMQMQALLAGVREASMAARPSRWRSRSWCRSSRPPREVIWIRERVMAAGRRRRTSAEARATLRLRHHDRAAARLPARRRDRPAHVDFFSFGTNDLTQTTYGISRDDAPAFLAAYQRKGLYELDPFVTLDEKGVGELIAIAIERGQRRQPRPQDRHLRRTRGRSGLARVLRRPRRRLCQLLALPRAGRAPDPGPGRRAIRNHSASQVNRVRPREFRGVYRDDNPNPA